MSVDPSKITERQQKMWSTGDFHRIGVAQVIVGEMLVRSLHVHAGERVLDVAGGAGLSTARQTGWRHLLEADAGAVLAETAVRGTTHVFAAVNESPFAGDLQARLAALLHRISPLVCRFSNASVIELFTRLCGRRSKSAKARNRGLVVHWRCRGRYGDLAAG